MEDSRLEGRERACKVGGKTQAEYRQAKAIVRELQHQVQPRSKQLNHPQKYVTISLGPGTGPRFFASASYICSD